MAAFTCSDSKSTKKTDNLFALLGSSCAKAALRTLMKLTPSREQKLEENQSNPSPNTSIAFFIAWAEYQLQDFTL